MISSLSKNKIKKWRKVRKKLENLEMIVLDEPSCVVAIANAGLGNGITVNQVISLLKPYGNVLDVKSNCDKSYALVVFGSEEHAKNCVENLQGHRIEKCAEDSESILYFFYLREIPIPLENNKSTTDFPSGLHKIDEFISVQEEHELLQQLDRDLNVHSQSHIQEKLKQRCVLHYGYKFRYGSNDVDCNYPLCEGGLPDFTASLISKIMATGYFKAKPDQLTVNKYSPGDGIPPHIDNPDAFGNTLATLSLGSPVVMEMKSENDQKVAVLLKPRTLTIFTGDSRYKWSHSIPAKKTDHFFDEENSKQCLIKRQTRFSMTFRTVVITGIDNSSAQLNDQNCFIPKDENEAADLEKQLVHDVYQNIAGHFSSTRDKPWPRVVKFLHSLEPGSSVLDVGCGSGRYLCSNSDISVLGCDYSSSLTAICSMKGCPVFICDGLSIPVRTNCFDASICIAVIHHYSSYKRRRKSIKELVRVVRKGGVCLIYVWAAEQKRNNIDSNYLKQGGRKTNSSEQSSSNTQREKQTERVTDETKHRLVVHKNRTEFAQQDVLVPWTMKSTAPMPENCTLNTSSDSTYYRFYHVFKQQELETLCESVPGCTVIDSYYDNGNWSATLRKD